MGWVDDLGPSLRIPKFNSPCYCFKCHPKVYDSPVRTRWVGVPGLSSAPRVCMLSRARWRSDIHSPPFTPDPSSRPSGRAWRKLLEGRGRTPVCARTPLRFPATLTPKGPGNHAPCSLDRDVPRVESVFHDNAFNFQGSIEWRSRSHFSLSPCWGLFSGVLGRLDGRWLLDDRRSSLGRALERVPGTFRLDR